LSMKQSAGGAEGAGGVKPPCLEGLCLCLGPTGAGYSGQGAERLRRPPLQAWPIAIASERRLAKRKGVTDFLGVHTDERARTATSVRTVVLANAAAGRDERHRLATSAERRRNLGKDDRTMFDIVAMRQGKARRGWGRRL
ncbi:hypothetical protein THAOC_22247, partial [Thalassiosira oceanica]